MTVMHPSQQSLLPYILLPALSCVQVSLLPNWFPEGWVPKFPCSLKILFLLLLAHGTMLGLVAL